MLTVQSPPPSHAALLYPQKFKKNAEQNLIRGRSPTKYTQPHLLTKHPPSDVCRETSPLVLSIYTLQNPHFRGRKTIAIWHPGGSHIHPFCSQFVEYHRGDKGFLRKITARDTGSFSDSVPPHLYGSSSKTFRIVSPIPVSHLLTMAKSGRFEKIWGGNNNKRKCVHSNTSSYCWTKCSVPCFPWDAHGLIHKFLNGQDMSQIPSLHQVTRSLFEPIILFP